ncbi:meiotic nuclear division protein 1, partial [Gilbertella persicaria]|uniref:meiotic nuclear division protein 1 n=1 Tax=Gilbertella persicaria TaxID=101096 RepID=UPI0022204E70
MVKGLSFEEKRKRIEQIFHDSGEFYQLKDVEKMGPKKGVVAQSVKEVLMSLVDDGLVVTDKIGTSNYFWSYPSEALKAKTNRLKDLQQKVNKENERKTKLEKSIEEAQQDRQPSDKREQVLSELEQLEQEAKALLKEIQQYKDNDPTLYEKKEHAAQIAKEAANRWTESVWEIQSYCVNKFGMERAVFDQTFGIKDDFDTL